MTALAACATSSGASRLSSTIFACKRGLASAAGTYGAPPALFTSTSSRVEGRHERIDLGLVAHVAAREHDAVRQRVGRGAPADDDLRAGVAQRAS